MQQCVFLAGCGISVALAIFFRYHLWQVKKVYVEPKVVDVALTMVDPVTHAVMEDVLLGDSRVADEVYDLAGRYPEIFRPAEVFDARGYEVYLVDKKIVQSLIFRALDGIPDFKVPEKEKQEINQVPESYIWQIRISR
jgi:hypothetical protein